MAKRKRYHRARAIGAAAARGIKGTAVSGVAGVASYFAHAFASEKIAYVGQHWYAGPALLAVGGHFLKRKPKTAAVGAAMIGAAGYAGALGYKLAKASETTKGLIQPSDVGALMNPIDPYALPDSISTDAAPGTSSYATNVGDLDDGDGDSVASAMGLR